MIFALIAVIPSYAGKCPQCKSVVEIVKDVSGESGFDNTGGDFYILRDLIVFAGVDNLLSKGGVEDVTVFAPTDLAFYRLAVNLGYNGYYDEAEVFSYIAGQLGNLGELNEIVKNILFYHVADQEVYYNELMDGSMVNTYFNSMQLGIDGSPMNQKIRLVHNANEFSFPYPEINYELKDVITCNGVVHTISDVLVPL